ncbi:MAG: response regulator transcription factor, partial [Anaerolineae bacterium]|nr:response regulator transcription factor [Anaerolineae bacterium]
MSQGTQRALIVEDSPAWQEILAEILTDMGLAVDIAHDLPSALASLRATPHRLAEGDLSLRPDDERNRDGLQVLDAVRRLDPGCAALLLTGYATVEIAVAALTQYHAATCLRKETFRRAEFRQTVRQLLALPPPAQLPTPAAAPPGPAAAPARDESKVIGRALLVEDDAGWRHLLAELLHEAGYAVRTSLSFGEALGHLRRERFDLAVADLTLASSTAPENNRDGFQVLREAQVSGIPTVVVSGQATTRDIERLYSEFGVHAYLEKQDFDRNSFLTAVQAATTGGLEGSDVAARLTKREQAVLGLLTRGLTNKAVSYTHL